MKRLLWLPTTVLLLFILAAMAGAQVSLGGNDDIVAFDPITGAEIDVDAFRAARRAERIQYTLLWLQAKTFLLKGESAKALPLLQKASGLNPTLISFNEMLADIYIQKNKPEDALHTMRPLVYSDAFVRNGVGGEITTHMKYVLALLDTGKWDEAVALYEKSVHAPLHWNVPGYDVAYGNKEHTLPDVHFRSEIYDEPDLRAQAHLILGSQWPGQGIASLGEKEGLEFMLDHLKQALKNNRNSLDAQFLIGVVLGNLERYEEAKAAFAVVAKNAPEEAQAEIKVALAQLAVKAKTKRIYLKESPPTPEQFNYTGDPIKVNGPGQREF